MILVSACLAGVECRYNRTASLVEELKELVDAKKAIAVCPELLGGLGLTRTPCEIQLVADEKKVFDADGIDNTSAFILGAEKTLEIAQRHHVKVAILKSKSPSCGCGEVYDGTFSKTLVIGDGFTAKLLQDNGIQVYTEMNYSL